MSEKNLLEAQLQQALTGSVKAFDSHVVLLDCGRTTQLVYRHAITDVTEATAAPGWAETSQARTPARSRNNERKRDDQQVDRPREKKPLPSPTAQRKEPQQQAHQPQTAGSPMPGALGEELRKWLQRTSK